MAETPAGVRTATINHVLPVSLMTTGLSRPVLPLGHITQLHLTRAIETATIATVNIPINHGINNASHSTLILIDMSRPEKRKEGEMNGWPSQYGLSRDMTISMTRHMESIGMPGLRTGIRQATGHMIAISRNTAHIDLYLSSDHILLKAIAGMERIGTDHQYRHDPVHKLLALPIDAYRSWRRRRNRARMSLLIGEAKALRSKKDLSSPRQSHFRPGALRITLPYHPHMAMHHSIPRHPKVDRTRSL